MTVILFVAEYGSTGQNGGQNGIKPCASPAGMRTECEAGSLNWSIFSASTVSIFVF
jgi:hypothetical protein